MALLFGDENDRAVLHTTSGADVFGPPQTQRTAAVRDRRSFAPMGEIEVGAEWSTELASSRLVIQGAFVGLAYDDVAFTGLSLTAGLQR